MTHINLSFDQWYLMPKTVMPKGLMPKGVPTEMSSGLPSEIPCLSLQEFLHRSYVDKGKTVVFIIS
jgi:hypothetical protein